MGSGAGLIVATAVAAVVVAAAEGESPPESLRSLWPVWEGSVAL